MQSFQFKRSGNAFDGTSLSHLTVDQSGLNLPGGDRFVEPQNPGYSKMALEEMESLCLDEANRLASEFEPRMKRFIKDEISVSIWEPPFDPPHLKIPENHKKFIHDLKIPRARGPHKHLPDMLRYELGRFQQEDKLKERIVGLFTKEPTHKIFVNTSGAGKTRAVLEHLCSSWGLYFSCQDDSHVGSKDVPFAMSNIRKALRTSSLPHAPNLLVTSADIAAYCRDKGPETKDVTEQDVLKERYSQFRKDVPQSEKFRLALERNQHLAGSELLVPLLARLLVFKQYIAAVKNINGDLSQMQQKRRWLHLQLHPHLLSNDGREDLFKKLAGDLNKWFERQSLNLSQKTDIIESLSQSTVDGIMEALGLYNGEKPLYIVIDECQFAVTDMEDLFRSADWTAKRGVLREIARWWDSVLNQRSAILVGALIFTGTGLSRELISDVLSSVVMKPDYCTSVYDTGAFDDPKAQIAYLKRFFPPDIWQSSERLRNRIHYWLRGRYRFTAEYVSLVLQCGYQDMHQLLDQYIRSVACFRPADFEEPEKDFFGIVTLPTPAFGFDKLDQRMRETVRTIAHEYLFTSKLETCLGQDERAYIELGLARISGYNGQLSLKIDEPLVLLSCSVWFNEQRSHTIYKTLAHHIQIHNPTTGRNGFEEFIAYYLLKVFQTPRKLNDVFDFACDNDMGNREAQLVTLHLDGSQRLVEGKVSLAKGTSSLFGPIGLSVGPEDHSALDEWLNLKRPAAFCFPMNYMGPDIMCFLKLKGNSWGKFTYVCLAIQCKFYRSQSLKPSTLKGAIATVTPGQFFQKDPSLEQETRRTNVLNALQSLVLKDKSAGNYGIIRIICGFPVDVDLNKAFPEAIITMNGRKRQRVPALDPDRDDDHALGKLKTALLISTTEKEHPTDILDVIRWSALDVKRKGLNFWDENDPAVLGINQRVEDVDLNAAVDLETEFSQCELQTESGRKRKRR
ncbi:hypothetical protein C8J55DRAFT_475003 [Lentinula edodes]|uniref:Uncharacterized protein n=1 Tax=Lentinula lateritia TaxID=40482 RepID=A0A9W9AD88_9AGAR|nr:hypothetical protein C8J55DRAFT_475003 [Lentinula edodes]